MNTNTKEKKELLDLTIYAFNKVRTPEREAAFFKLLDFSTPYTHREKDELTSMVIDSHFEVFWKSQKVKMSGLGYVASYPEFRGNGGIRKIMTKLLRDNYEVGTALSYLAPFSYEFYGKFGYAYSFDRKVYTIPAYAFPIGKKGTGEITRKPLKDIATRELWLELNGIHEKSYNQGSLARSQDNWEYYFLHKFQPQVAIYREAGEAQGYLLYDFSGKTFEIIELISQTTEAKEALYRFISSHAGQFENFRWTTTPDMTLEYDMTEPEYAQIQLVPYMQARIVNLTEFLKVNGLPSFSAEVVDELIPENNIIVGSGQIEKMTIGEFTAKVLRENQAIIREYF